jgi:HAE1 family hydrophobic/amphiphilic exporter-1
MKGQRLNASIIVQSLLKTPEEFAAIPIRTNPDGSIVRIRDVGRTELGTESYGGQSYFNGMPSSGLAIRQAAGANALNTANAIRAKMEEMSRFFPTGMKVVYPYDTTPFVKVAIEEVVKTLIEAILLVFLVMYLFMGTMRATLIPTIAVPVVILGTFAVLGLFNFSINMLTMFGMVLAIGLLVDDAIVVVENVERIMHEEGLSPKEATRKSMDQITSALIGIGLVLSAVFGPMAFFGGSTGVIYRQFSVTIISSMLLSVLVALILTPVLCASLLKPVAAGHEPAENAVFFLRPFFRWFDRIFFGSRDLYVRMVRHSLSRKLRYLVVFLLIVAAMGFLFLRMPTAYLPDEDQGILMVQVLLPANSTLDRQGHGGGRGLFSGARERRGGRRHDAFRQKLLRPGAERGHGLCPPEGLGTPGPAGAEGNRCGQKGHGGIFQDPQRYGVCLSAAAGDRIRRGEGF